VAKTSTGKMGKEKHHEQKTNISRTYFVLKFRLPSAFYPEKKSFKANNFTLAAVV
jgi:hypothetical protein